jgi:hypothetical protein
MRNDNRTGRRNIRAAVRKISETFRIIFKRRKSFTARSSIRTSSSPEVADLERSGGRSATALP